TVRRAERMGCSLESGANSAVGRAAGISNEELAALRGPLPEELFVERERAALAYADAIVAAHAIDAELFAEVSRHFSEEEMIELTAAVTFEICAAKFNRALEIEWGVCNVSQS